MLPFDWGVVVILLISLVLKNSIVNAANRKRINFQPAVMSADDVVSYFKSFIAKSSSVDKANEQFYAPEEYSEDLYHKIDNLMPQDHYIKWLRKTKEITDKSNEKKASLLSKYGNSINSPCKPSSVFNQTLQKILQTWDGDRTIVINELEEWHRLNEFVPPRELCNRFRGLTCQKKRAVSPDVDQGRVSMETENTTCQCGGDSANVGFFRPSAIQVTKDQGKQTLHQAIAYPDGCYIRPWRPCKHLSAVDNAFKSRYDEWHSSLENDRRMLAQMIFPVARTHRCKEGTYCLDMIPGMKKPICWCTFNSDDPECKLNAMKNDTKNGFIPPLGTELMSIRKAFAKIIIHPSDSRTPCNPEYNEQVLQLANGAGLNPSKTGAIDVMKKLAYTGRTIRICDFREALVCDKRSRICKGNLNCGPGKVHLGKGVCVSDNGYQCQSNEDCVQNARCTYFKEASDSACVCETGYGDECHLKNKPFFGTRFLPMISGVQDDEYIQLQVIMYKILESWEDSMKLKLGDSCDATFDKDSMDIVNYFGSFTQYDKAFGAVLLTKAKKVTRDASGQLCNYKQFQHCDPLQKKCVPFVGKKIIATANNLGDPSILVEVDHLMECSVKMPKIFENIVKIECIRGYKCDFKIAKKYCLPDCDSPFAPKKECLQSRNKPDGSIGDTNEDDDNDDDIEMQLAGSNNDTTPVPTSTEAPSTSPTTESLPSTTLMTEAPTTTEVQTTPTPELIAGSSCTKADECPAEKFLDCSFDRGRSDGMDVSVGTCICMGGLMMYDSIKCEIPYDGRCGNGWGEMKTLGLSQERYEQVLQKPPDCRQKSECADNINNKSFCRPINEDGAIFVTPEKLRELQSSYPDHGFIFRPMDWIPLLLIALICRFIQP